MALSGSLADFPLEHVLRLLESTGKTGVLEIAGEGGVGALEVTDGALTGARVGDDSGEPALGAIFSIRDGQFSFRDAAAGAPTLGGSLEALLERAEEERKRLEAIRRDIPDDRMRFALSARAASGGSITVSADHWRVLLAVDGRRDVRAIAERLKSGRLATLRHLHALLTAGLVDTLEPGPPEEMAPPAPAMPEPGTMPPAAPRWETAAPETMTPAYEAPASESTARAFSEAPPPLYEPPLVFEPPPPVFEAPAEPPPLFEAPRPIEPRGATAPPAEDLAAALDERLSALGSPPAPPSAEPAPPAFWEPRVATPAAEPAPPGPAADDRLAALFGRAPSPEAPAAPAAPATERKLLEPEGEVSQYLPTDATAPILEPPPPPPPPKVEKRGGLFGLFGIFRPKSTPAMEPPAMEPTAMEPRVMEPRAPAGPAPTAASSPARLAAFANALVAEYNSGQYGRGRLDERMNVRLRIVDEQADPIDRALPVTEERLDVGAIDQGEFDHEQILPYLATLVRQIYDDAERVFGKDRAKKGYKTAIKHGLAGDEVILRDPRLVPLLPKS